MRNMTIKYSRGTGRALVAAIVGIVALFASTYVSAHETRAPHDYPTYARAEYVYVCMSSNGANEYVLRQCSCAIDEIAKRMSYDDYVAAETAVRMRQMEGEKAAQFREVEVIKKTVNMLQAAQAEAEIACF